MSSPIVEVFMFERVLHAAVAAWLIANGINDPAKQNDDKGLLTPRVELKTALSGWWGSNSNSPHMWVPTSGDSYPDTRTGTLYVKVITNRGDDTQDHDRIVGTVRGLLHNRSQISQKMDLHTLNRIVENASVPDFDQSNQYSLTALSFAFTMSILYATKTATIFPA